LIEENHQQKIQDLNLQHETERLKIYHEVQMLTEEIEKTKRDHEVKLA
jgi:hypothetical protein